MNPIEQEQVNHKELAKQKRLADKSLLITVVGTFLSFGIGTYFYTRRWKQVIPAFFISCLIGCVVMSPDKDCQTISHDGYYGEFCQYFWNIGDIMPIFTLFALIDNANAIASARVKLKQLQKQGVLPENIEAFKLTLLKLIDDRGEAAVSELVIATSYSATVIRSVLAILEKEEVVCVGNREDGTIVYRLI